MDAVRENPRFGRRLGINLFELDGKWLVNTVRGDRRWLQQYWVLPVVGDLEGVIREIVAISETAEIWDDAMLAKGFPRGELLGTTEKKFERFARWSSLSFVWYEDSEIWRRAVSPSPTPSPGRSWDDFVLEVSDVAGIAELLVKYLEFSPNSGVSRDVVVPRAGKDVGVGLGSGRSWLAVRSDDSKLVAKRLGVKGLVKVGWADGLVDCERSGWFVSPPVDGWVLAVSTDLQEEVGVDDEEAVGHFIVPLSRKLKTDVQLFHWDVDVEGCVAGWASSGKLVRLAGFGWEGEGPLTLVEEQLFAEPGADVAEFAFSVGWLPQVAAAWGCDVTALGGRAGLDPGWQGVREPG